jgi:CRP-like cAMP-binding protein
MKGKMLFYSNYPTTRFLKGETILIQDEIPKNIYFVKTGTVISCNITRSGEHQTVAFETIGDVIPKCWAFSKTTRTLFYYVAFTDCELYIVNKNIFISHLKNDVDFSNITINRMACSLIRSRLQIDSLGKTHAFNKVLYIFRYLSLMHGHRSLDENIKIKFSLTQQDISNITGLTRETVSHEIKCMKEKGIICSKNSYYVIDTKILNSYIEDEYDPGIVSSILIRPIGSAANNQA